MKKEILNDLIEKYSDDIDNCNFKNLASEIAKTYGAIEMRELEEDFKAEGINCNFEKEIASKLTIIDDVVFSADKKKLIKYAPEKTSKTYIIPDFVETVSDNAFEGNFYIKSVTVSKNIHHIGSKAFRGCKYLSEVVWDTNGTTCGSHVFENCPKLKKVITDDVNKLLRSVCDNYGSPFINDAVLIVNGEVCDKITIPDNIDKFSLRCLKGCTSIKNITFEASNKNVEEILLNEIEHKCQS